MGSHPPRIGALASAAALGPRPNAMQSQQTGERTGSRPSARRISVLTVLDRFDIVRSLGNCRQAARPRESVTHSTDATIDTTSDAGRQKVVEFEGAESEHSWNQRGVP